MKQKFIEFVGPFIASQGVAVYESEKSDCVVLVGETARGERLAATFPVEISRDAYDSFPRSGTARTLKAFEIIKFEFLTTDDEVAERQYEKS